MSRSPRAARTEEDAPPTDWLGELPPELHLRILEGVDDFSDCAAFSLASPRLGLLALRSGLARFKDPLFAVAMRLLLTERLLAGSFVGAPIMDTLNEATLRAYAADRRAAVSSIRRDSRQHPSLPTRGSAPGSPSQATGSGRRWRGGRRRICAGWTRSEARVGWQRVRMRRGGASGAARLPAGRAAAASPRRREGP